MTRAYGLGLLVVLVVTTLLAGCAIFAGKGEYASYREVRLAENVRSRLLAIQRYRIEYPNGKWTVAFQAERQRVEPQMWEENRGSVEGLRFYLEAFPDGPHASEAAPMLAALERVAGNRQSEAEAAAEVERQRREALLERQRTWMTRASQFWTRTLVGITNWGNPIAAVAGANPGFSAAFGANPPPRCSREECIKFYHALYSIPVPGSNRLDREIDMFLRLRMRDGNLFRAEMLLPNKGFSRWFEQENRTIVVDEDPEQRQQAINWAVDKILPALREVAPNAQPIDVVPEPIDPPTVRAPNQPDDMAGFAPGDEALQAELREAAEAARREQEQQRQQRQQQEDATRSEIDELLERAAGSNPSDDPLPPTPEDQTAPPPDDEPESMVMPIALQGYQIGPVRVVLFAASDDDYGRAYDGLFIEFEAPAPEAPAPRRGRRPGR